MRINSNELFPGAPTGSAPVSGRPGLPPIRLWVVDDNDRLRRTVVELLACMDGVECDRHFASATAALSALASKAGPDVILLDIQMGRENGLDAVRPIKTLSRHTRVFMFTTLDDRGARQRAMEDGASGFLLKRCPLEDLVNRLREPGEFEGRPAGRHRTVAVKLSPPSCLSDQRPQRVPPGARAGARLAGLKRCLARLTSFWN